jgi:protein-S-isoprenylcysteine O-methyltransferase Ste14
MHSYLVTTGTTMWIKKRFEKKFPFYRIFYNLFSFFTVLPLLYWQHALPGPIIIPLSPYLIFFKYIALIMSVIIVAGSFATFDIREFTGIRQAKSKHQKKEIGPVIKNHGFYGIVRHPMYLGGIIFFMASMTHAPLPQFAGYLILAAYMIIGTVREDRRLARELGSVYSNYQKEVPMLLPGITRRKIGPWKRV